MNEHYTSVSKKISLPSGKRSVFYNLNDVCYIAVKNDKVIFMLTNKKEITILQDFETLKPLLLTHHFIQIGENLLVNRNEIKAIRDNGEDTKIFTTCNMVIHINEQYSNLKKQLAIF